MTPKMWEHTFAEAEHWHIMAREFDVGFVFYLPFEQPLTNTCYICMKLADKRFEKLKKMEFSWVVNMLKDSFPAIRQKLYKLTSAAQNLQTTGQVGTVADYTVVEEKQWTSVGLLNISSTSTSQCSFISDSQSWEQSQSRSCFVAM